VGEAFRDDGGGSVSLLELVERHGEAVEADLQRFYRIRLADLAAGRLSWRRFGVLVRHLPLDSATALAVNGDAAAWGITEHLLAAAVDALNAANWQRAGDKKLPRPKPIPRPGTDRRLSVEMAERLRDFQRRHAARG
jgi:hypothetical protein